MVHIENRRISRNALVKGGAVLVVAHMLNSCGGSDTPSPTEPNGGHTQTVTPEPNTPPAGVTVAETPTATPVETVSPSPEPTEEYEPIKTLEEQLPYELAENSRVTYKGKYINIHFGVDTDTQTKNTCDKGTEGEVSCYPVQRFYLSSETLRENYGMDLSDEELITRLEDGVLEGHLLILKLQDKYKDWTLDTLKQRISDIREGKDVEHPTYIIYGGMEGNQIVGGAGAKIDAAAEDFYLHKVNKVGYVKFTDSSSFNFREIEDAKGNDGVLVMEIWDDGGSGVKDNNPELNRKSFVIGIEMANGFGVAATPSFHDGRYHEANEDFGRELELKTKNIANNVMPKNQFPELGGIFGIE